MSKKPDICPICNKGFYEHGSASYDYYSCDHAYEKPLNNDEKGRWVYYPSPYKKRNARGL